MTDEEAIRRRHVLEEHAAAHAAARRDLTRCINDAASTPFIVVPGEISEADWQAIATAEDGAVICVENPGHMSALLAETLRALEAPMQADLNRDLSAEEAPHCACPGCTARSHQRPDGGIPDPFWARGWHNRPGFQA